MKNLMEKKWALAGLATLWGAIPVVLAIYWLVLHLIFRGYGGLQQSFSLWLNMATNVHSGVFMVWLTVCFFLSAALLLIVRYSVVDSTSSGYNDWYSSSQDRAKTDAQRDAEHNRVRFSTRVYGYSAIVLGLIAVLSFANLIVTTNMSDQTASSFYDRAAVVYTPSIKNAPGALQYLLSGAKKSSNGCWEANSPVPNCVKIGTLPQAGFDPRVSSAAGALTVMQRTSGTRQNVNLWPASLEYLNGNGKDGVWSAIRDGSGVWQPTEGVVEWNGQSLPTECTFGGTDRFNRAFHGQKSNSLINYVKRAYPNLYWSDNDTFGYCSPQHRPVIVLPVSKQISYASATLSVPAGVLVLKGSRSGNPKITYMAHAKNLPGAAYPVSVADAQLASVNFLAGRGAHDKHQFGFETANASGNISDFLLKSRADGHVYWVTPLTLANSQSQLFVAYAMVRADTVTSGHLNQMKIYVLGENDPRAINIDQLEAAAKTYMVNNAGGFIPSGGQLLEFTPAQGDFWRAFGEINGRVIYRLDISANANETPILVSLDQGSTSTTPTGSTPTSPNASSGQLPSYCTQSLGSLSTSQKFACARYFLN